jgi:hypothetical protein
VPLRLGPGSLPLPPQSGRAHGSAADARKGRAATLWLDPLRDRPETVQNRPTGESHVILEHAPSLQNCRCVIDPGHRYIASDGDAPGAASQGRRLNESQLKRARLVALDEVDAETSVESILVRHGERRLSAEEFEEHFGDLPRDGEG